MREESRLIAARRWVRAHPGTLLVATFAASALVMWLIPVSGIGSSLGQSAVLAAVALLAMLLWRSEMLGWHAGAGTDLEADTGDGSKPHDGSNAAVILKLGWYPLVVAVVFGGAIAWGLSADGLLNLGGTSSTVAGSNSTDVFLALVPICLLTGFFEEVLFRGLLFNMIAERLAGNAHGTLIAALASAVVFGLLHVVGDALSPFPFTLLRFVQAGIFGFFMCAVYRRTKSIWSVALIHGLYDVFALWPSTLVMGYPVAALMPAGTAGLIMNGALVLAFIPLVLVSARMLNSER